MPVARAKVPYDIEHGKDIGIVLYNTHDGRSHPVEGRTPDNEALLNQRSKGIGDHLDDTCMLETSYKGKKGNIEEYGPPVKFGEDLLYVGNLKGKFIFKQSQRKG